MPRSARWALVLSSLLTLAAAVSDANKQIPCKRLEVEGHTFDFSELAGPHTVVTTEYAPPSHYNRTYTLDLCAPLVRKGDIEANFRCPEGTHVCGIKHHWDPEAKKSTVEEVIPIAGELEKHGGTAFKWEAAKLKGGVEGEGEASQGLKLTLRGGMFEQREQRAVVEFRCNKTLTGLEGETESEDKYEKGVKKRDDKKGNGDEVGWPEKQVKNRDAALIWDGYKREGNVDTLYLTWHTKHACASAVEEKPPASDSTSWGFFTWLIILVFLAVAAYLIFGSWLNYNRYGARGWDLLPHGDTLRDIPYLLKDWIRRVLNTVQSSGSRGGYSAV